ncbi:MAG: hypothetical protein GY894_01045 [Planctomycetes bacterium]|jgi:hypothetical protein|nr:hypothetical protein [Planctomycetota bacterium]MCP4837935.1 hypothetical protein [Planctomycetota bacterium]
MIPLLSAAPVSESTGATWAELILLGVAVLLTIGVAAFMLTFFITQQRRETRSERKR